MLSLFYCSSVISTWYRRRKKRKRHRCSISFRGPSWDSQNVRDGKTLNIWFVLLIWTDFDLLKRLNKTEVLRKTWELSLNFERLWRKSGITFLSVLPKCQTRTAGENFKGMNILPDVGFKKVINHLNHPIVSFCIKYYIPYHRKDHLAGKHYV